MEKQITIWLATNHHTVATNSGDKKKNLENNGN